MKLSVLNWLTNLTISILTRLEAGKAEQFTLPEKSLNFDKAVESINALTWKGRRAFFFRLIQGVTDADRKEIRKYLDKYDVYIN